MTILDDLLKQATAFVDKQKGFWDHTTWQSFLSDIQKKGIELTDEKSEYLGTVLESMKKFYETSIVQDANKRFDEIMSKISDQTTSFLEKTEGIWDHAGWENFIEEIQKKGINITEDTVTYIGDILESSKKLYNVLPFVETKKEAPKKAAPKEAALKEEKKAKPKKNTKTTVKTRKTATVKKTTKKTKPRKTTT